jgi:hypothetical protein
MVGQRDNMVVEALSLSTCNQSSRTADSERQVFLLRLESGRAPIPP